MEERTIVSSPAERPVGASASVAGPLEGSPLADPRALSILTTEHWSLLTARSLVYNEAFARAGMFLSFLAASLVALGLMSAAMGFSPEFRVVAVLILGLDLFIGLATTGRVSTATSEDIRMLQGMNRLRHAYHETVPGLERYFITGHYDDLAGVFQAYNADVRLRSRRSILHGFTTVVGMLVVIDSALAAVLVASLVLFAAGAGLAAVAAGVVVFAITLTIGVDWMTRSVAGTASGLQVEFPSPPPASS
jgi:ABC-type transport system involved in cytochrome bd biosynthesis fused ATPase/permease subunit